MYIQWTFDTYQKVLLTWQLHLGVIISLSYTKKSVRYIPNGTSMLSNEIFRNIADLTYRVFNINVTTKCR